MVQEENSKYLSIEEVIGLPDYQDTAVSEDGERVAYVRKTPDWNDNTYRSHIWIYDVKAEKSYPLTVGEQESLHPRWSPDSQYLAYLSPSKKKGEAKKDIFLHSPSEADTIQISYENEPIESFKWTPDGKGFIYLTHRSDAKMKQRKDVYGDFTYIDKDFQYNSLYFLPLEKGNKGVYELFQLPGELKDADDEHAIPLVDSGHLYIKSYDVAPDGKKIVVSATPTPNFDDFFDQEIYLVDIGTKEQSKLDVNPLHVGEVMFSHDGSKLCYRRFETEQSIFNNTTVETYNLETKQTTLLASDIDENVLPVRWTEKGILVTWQDKTNVRVGILEENGNMESLFDSNDIVVTHASITADGHHMAYVKATSEDPLNVYINDKRMTNQSTYYEGKATSQKEIINWRTSDGLNIEGILSKPTDFDPSRTYPLVLVVHGGPVGTSFTTRTMHKYQPVEQFVEKGFLVLEPNYRGSAGYGEAFRKANYRKLGLGDYEDVITGVDSLIEKGWVDSKQVGIMGWSQGGYISAFCATYSHRFKATSVGAGITNWVTYYTNTDITHFTRFYLGDTPWNDQEIYDKTSPMTYINNASTPTLIQHGEKDHRVPVPNAFELYRGLKDVGVKTELVIFKGMKHGSDQPGIHRAILKQNLDWFSYHILGEKNRDDSIY